MIYIFSILLFFHVEKYNRVVEMMYTKDSIILEVLQIFFPYEKEYDAKRRSMDRNGDGLITEEEASDFARKEGVATGFSIILKSDDRRILLKRVKSSPDEYPERTYESRPIAIWHRFEGRSPQKCGSFSYFDLYPFRKAVVKIRFVGVCGIKDKEIVKELTPQVREVKLELKTLK